MRMHKWIDLLLSVVFVSCVVLCLFRFSDSTSLYWIGFAAVFKALGIYASIDRRKRHAKSKCSMDQDIERVDRLSLDDGFDANSAEQGYQQRTRLTTGYGIKSHKER